MVAQDANAIEAPTNLLLDRCHVLLVGMESTTLQLELIHQRFVYKLRQVTSVLMGQKTHDTTSKNALQALIAYRAQDFRAHPVLINQALGDQLVLHVTKLVLLDRRFVKPTYVTPSQANLNVFPQFHQLLC